MLNFILRVVNTKELWGLTATAVWGVVWIVRSPSPLAVWALTFRPSLL
jgi:hypothetical protein